MYKISGFSTLDVKSKEQLLQNELPRRIAKMYHLKCATERRGT